MKMKPLKWVLVVMVAIVLGLVLWFEITKPTPWWVWAGTVLVAASVILVIIRLAIYALTALAVAITCLVVGLVVASGPGSSEAEKHSCEQLQSQFAVPAQQCTPEDVTPRPLGEISPDGERGACWLAHHFDSPAKAGVWLKTDEGKFRSEQYSQFASGHRDYYGYTGRSGTDYANYVSGLVREVLPYPIRVLNHYCDANGIKVWQVQVLPKGEAVYFVPGFAPSQVSIRDIRPVDKEACGNPLLPPPPPPPAVCPPGTGMAGKPLPPGGVKACSPPGTTTKLTSRTKTTPPRTTTTTTPPGKEPNRNPPNTGRNGQAPPQQDPEGPPAGGQPPATYNSPDPVPATTVARPPASSPPITVDPEQSHTSASPPPTNW